MTIRELFLVSILFILIPIALFLMMNGKSPSDLGSLLGSFSGLIAIIWFYRGLRLQSIQIEEQRQQFDKQFKIQHQDSLFSFLTTSSDKMKSYTEELIKSLGISDGSEAIST